MEINKKTRTELKNYFLAGKIPTQQHFGELIDACLNQVEDGIAKAPGGPIALAAEGDKAGVQDALHFFTGFEDENLQWAINLNPRVDPDVPGSNQPGWNIKDGSGQSRLFIKSGYGHVGIGTIEPVARLSIKGQNNVPLIAAMAADSDKVLFEISQTASFFLSKVGIGTTDAAAPLTIFGAGKESGPDTSMHITSQSILFGGNNAGKHTDSAKIITGTLAPDSLNIVGMGTTDKNRKVDIWAEGGMTVRGQIKTNTVVAFSAYVQDTLSGNQKVLKMEALYNTGNCFNNTTSRFTAPVKGLYLFTMTINKVGNDDSLHWSLRLNDTLYVNGTGTVDQNQRAMLTAKHLYNTYSRTIITTLNAGDVVHVEQTGLGYGDNYRSGWEGVLLHALS